MPPLNFRYRRCEIPERPIPPQTATVVMDNTAAAMTTKSPTITRSRLGVISAPCSSIRKKLQMINVICDHSIGDTIQKLLNPRVRAHFQLAGRHRSNDIAGVEHNDPVRNQESARQF